VRNFPPNHVPNPSSGARVIHVSALCDFGRFALSGALARQPSRPAKAGAVPLRARDRAARTTSLPHASAPHTWRAVRAKSENGPLWATRALFGLSAPRARPGARLSRQTRPALATFVCGLQLPRSQLPRQPHRARATARNSFFADRDTARSAAPSRGARENPVK